MEGYEDFIDNAHLESFGSLTVGPESLNIIQEYEEWIDKRYEVNLSAPPQVELSRKEDRFDVSTHKEDSVKWLEAALERFYPTIVSSPAQ